MDDDVLLKLSLARQYLHHANFAGTPRQAIADGYSAVDAVLSALLIHDGIDPPRNHKAKFDLARRNCPDALAAEVITRKTSSSYSPGADWDSLEEFYKEWLASRYDPFEMDAATASARVREAGTASSAAIRFLAKAEGIDSRQLAKTVCELAFGYEFSQASIAVGEAHEYLFNEAERLGGLGVKFASTTNYCALDIITGDELTQAIICEDEEIARDAAALYHSFIELVEKIDERRLHRISGGKPSPKCSREERNNAPDFMLSLRARYHGGTIEQLGERWGKVLGAGMAAISKKRAADSTDA
jgi:hypothetical protein